MFLLIDLFLIILLLISLSIIWPPGAPWVPAPREKIDKMLKMLKVKPNEVVYDLGSGDGRILIWAAKKFGAKGVGVEIDPLKTFYSHFMLLLFGLNKYAKIIRGDFYKVDLSKANVVTLFLLPETNQKLKDKLQKELRTGSRIVSYAFKFDGWKPSKKLFNQDSAFGPIYLYIR